MPFLPIQRSVPLAKALGITFTTSYHNLCRRCERIPVHKSNKDRICPDCMQDLLHLVRVAREGTNETE